jgi:fructuronate reductase
MPRILHLGLGNFHRAHQAWHTARSGGWKITGVVMGNNALYDTMKRQGGAYHLGIRGAEGLQVHKIAVHDRLLLARADPHAVVAAIADSQAQIITLTVTEKGYDLGPDGRLNLASPGIAQDLTGHPRSTIGMLAHGLAMRSAPVTVISCDNMSGNGHKLRSAVADFARAAGLRLTADIRFPNSMVDRITPATTDAIRSEIEAASGVVDAAPVLTEAFSEWIIEDDFAGLRPQWETAGVEIVPNVGPYEMRKLRLLNAAHSYLAYAGLLAGHRYVHEAMADAALRAGVERLWDEAQATLPDSLQVSVPAYRASLVQRFAVAEMRHELAQIACDGSLKLCERVVPLVTLHADAPQARRVLAAWIAFVIRSRHRGETLRDPSAGWIASVMHEAPDTGALCRSLLGLLGLTNVSSQWREALTADVERLAVHAPKSIVVKPAKRGPA